METAYKYLKVSSGFAFTSAATLLIAACAPPEEEAPAPVAPARYLYVAAGACYSGAGNTTFTNATSSNVLYRVNVATGVKDITLADYNSSPAQSGDSPVGVANADANFIYALIENTTTPGARRIEKIRKTNNGARTTFTNNTTALSSQVRDLRILSNGDFLISKSTAIEKLTSANIRVTQGVNPYVNAPAGACLTSTTQFSKTIVLANQFIVFLHSAVGQNRIGIIKPAGYSVVGDCAAVQASPTALAFPVAVAYDQFGSNLIVAYAGSTTATDINSIYVYPLTETASSVTIGAAIKIYDVSLYPATYPFILYGISEMTFDATTNKLYISTAVNTSTTVPNYAIDRFSYDRTKIGTANSTVLTKDSTTPFYSYGGDTKCISQMMVAD